MNTLNFEGKTYQLTEIEPENPNPPKKPKTIWDLEVGDEYYMICPSSVTTMKWGGVVDRSLRDSGNCFLTKPEAEKELKKRQAIQRIKKYIHDEGMEWEWTYGKHNHYIVCDIYTLSSNFQSFGRNFDNRYKNYSPIGYLSSEFHVQKIIDNFSPELKLIFEV